MSRPNFLIVGACKSGTTSVYEYLRDHPQLFLPADNKEPNRFAPSTGRFRASEEAYRRSFADAGDALGRGEASTSYLYDPQAPALIADELGAATRILIFLRNPVDMAYSLWGHQVREGYETLEFADALDAEARRIADPAFRDRCGGWWANFAYVDRARYAEQVRRYLDRFGSEQVRVYLFEEFFRDDLPQYAELLRFLEVDPSHRPEGRAHNRAGRVRSRWLQEALRTPRFWKAPLKRGLPSAIQERIKRSLGRWNRVDAGRRPLDPALRATLDRRFRDDAIDLGRQLQRDLLTIWQPGSRAGRAATEPVESHTT